MALTRNTAGLIYRDDFASLSGWTAPAEWTVDTTRPVYVAYTSDVAVLTGGAVGSADGSGPREGHLMQVSDSLWYLFYDAGDGNNSGSAAAWRIQYAKSTDRGVTWTKMGDVQGITQGSFASRCNAGFIWKEAGVYYLHVLSADSVTNGIPNTSYHNTIYSSSDIEGTWSFVRETPALGGSGSFDEVTVNVGCTKKIGSDYHHWWSARTASTSADPAWTIGHGTSTTPDGAITKDGAGAFIGSAVTGTSRARSENPKTWYSATLGIYALAANSVNSTGGFTDGNDIFYSPSQTDFQSSVYRVRTQDVQWTGYDGINAVGLISPVYTEAGAVVEDSGFVPFTWDSDPPSVFNGAANDGYHRGRKIRQGVLEPSPASASVSALGLTKHLYRSMSHSDFVAEFALDLPSGANSGTIGLCYRMSSADGTDGFNGYIILISLGDNALSCYRRTSGTWNLVGYSTRAPIKEADSVNIAFDRWKIVVSGGSHKVYFNGSSTASLDVTDSTYLSGSHMSFRGECNAKVRLFSARNSDTVTVTGLTSGDAVVLRGHGGVIIGSTTANGSGVATITNKHFPVRSIDVGGTNHTPSDGGLIWGGDSFSVAGGTITAGVEESFSSSDTAIVIASYAAAADEIIAALDSLLVVWITSSGITETATVADAVSVLMATNHNATESISATDGTSASYSTSGAASESITSSDSQSSAMAGSASAAESISSADSSSSTNFATAAGSESVSASESSDWSAANAASVAESVSASDAQSVIAAFVASVIEAIAASTTESAIYATSSAVAEASSLLDTVDFSGSSSADASESVSATDSPSALHLVSGGIVEAVSLDDAWSAIATVYGQAGDTLMVLDTPTATAIMGSAVIELVSLTDSHYGFTIWTVARGGVFVRQALNSVVVREVSTDEFVIVKNKPQTVRN